MLRPSAVSSRKEYRTAGAFACSRRFQFSGIRRRLRPVRALAAVIVLLCAACADDDPAGPTPPSSALRYSTIDGGYYHTCALTLTGGAHCWGRNAFGTLGDGTTDERSRPTRVNTSLSFSSLDAGAGHNCAVTAAGTAWCWGLNDEGQLGDGTFNYRTVPVAVSGGHTFTAVSAGHAHSCGLTADGTAWCWGDDSHGQLGDGGPTGPGKSPEPVPVQSAEPFASIYAGYYQSCGITTTAMAYCWGQNVAGQIGDGSRSERHAPAPVSGGLSFRSLAPGDRFVCGASSGDVWCWGANTYGQLGPEAPDTALVPVRLDGVGSTPSAIFASSGASTIPGTESYGCALFTNGRTDCWGGAVPGLRQRGAPAPLDERIRAAGLAAGAQHICLLSRDGYAYCGGANFAGQLGDGTRTARAELVPVHGPGT